MRDDYLTQKPPVASQLVRSTKRRLGVLCLAGAGLLCLTGLLPFSARVSEAYTLTKSVHGGQYPTYPKVEYGTGVAAEQIKRGEYLAKVGDCIACHTAKGGEPFAGGLPIKTPFGTLFTPNITSDKETGIGKWRDDDFVKAMRQGISPAGSYYFPVFPYVAFNKLNRADVLAIKAYLAALPPVSKKNRAPQMGIPFRWRFLQFGWRLLFFHEGEFKPDSRRSAQWNRGAYLVQGLGHCGMCHTPLNFLGAEKKAYYLTGGFVDGFYAPDITRAAFERTRVPEIVDVFIKDKLIGGGKVLGPMEEVNHDSLKYLNTADLEAIAVYLKTVKSQTPPQPKHADSINITTGKKIYAAYCVSCHATGAGGAPKLGDTAAWAPKIKLGLNVLYKNAIVGIGGMPPKGTCDRCNHAEIQSAVKYMVEAAKTGHGGETAKPKIIIPKPTLARGKKVYEEVCAVCHTSGKLGAPVIGDKTVWAPLIKQNMDVLITRTIKGYRGHPPMGACYGCTDTDVIAAVKYIVEESKTSGDYRLW